MSSTGPHNLGHQPQHDEHEKSDFNWTLILWSVPLSAIILITFTLTCLFFFRSYKDDAILAKSAIVTTDLNALRLSEEEILSQYKIISKDSGRYQIPIIRAMELVVAENQNVSGRDWTPMTDIYLQTAPFVLPAAKGVAPVLNGISIEEAEEVKTKAEHGNHPESTPKQTH